jgi:hypothetical protein
MPVVKDSGTQSRTDRVHQRQAGDDNHVAFGRLVAAISILVAGCVPAGATAMVTVDAWWQLTSTIYEAADGSFYHGCDTRDGDFVFGFVCNGNAAPGDYTEGYPGPGLFKPGAAN